MKPITQHRQAPSLSNSVEIQVAYRECISLTYQPIESELHHPLSPTDMQIARLETHYGACLLGEADDSGLVI